MAGGEVQFQLFNRTNQLTIKPEKVDVPLTSINECCFQLSALADLTSDNVHKNDHHSVFFKYDVNLFPTIKLFLQKSIAGTFSDVAEIIDNSYGVYDAYGSYFDSETNYMYGSFNIDWKLVLSAFDDGIYRIRFNETDYSSTESDSYYQFEFCLKQYTPNRANNTVRFDWINKGYNADYAIDTDIWNYNVVLDLYPDGFFNQIRLGGFFGDNKSSYEREYIKYSNGQQVYIKDQQIEIFDWSSSYYPAEVHSFIKTNMIQADSLTVTDYNKNNPNVITDKAIKPNSNYEPRWTQGRLNAPVEMEFTEEFQNKRKKRC